MEIKVNGSNNEIKIRIHEILDKANEPITAVEVAEECEISTQKASAILMQMVRNGDIEQNVIRQRRVYTSDTNEVSIEWEVVDDDEIDFNFESVSFFEEIKERLRIFILTFLEEMLDINE